MLLVVGIVILIPVPENKNIAEYNRLRVINITAGDKIYRVNPWVVLPASILTGFCSGMVGISGGSFFWFH
jgi:uncharacterized membrane protein YfcA